MTATLTTPATLGTEAETGNECGECGCDPCGCDPCECPACDCGGHDDVVDIVYPDTNCADRYCRPCRWAHGKMQTSRDRDEIACLRAEAEWNASR